MTLAEMNQGGVVSQCKDEANRLEHHTGHRKELSMATQGTEGRRQGESQTATAIKHGASDAFESTKSTVREAGTRVAEQVQSAASAAYQKANETAANAGKAAESALSSAAGQMHSLAGTIRETLPSEGMSGKASRAVSDTLDSGARYLEEEGLSGMGRDLASLIRRNPFPALFIGVCFGYWLGRIGSKH
jgi:hypothetical protein